MIKLSHTLEARLPYLEPEFSDDEYDRRLASVRAGMETAGLDALLIYCGASSYASARWLTNYEALAARCSWWSVATAGSP
jgi:hypothetical protein